MNGTAWLITPKLLITNHHVINARLDHEPDASDSDFKLQAKGTAVLFDFNSQGVAGTEIDASSLEASDKSLDYAILRLKAATDRNRLLLNTNPVVLKPTSFIPVNIIQHPGGNPKRIAIRNNLVTAADKTDIRYFTDTKHGSSGSPVFDDQWSVVALHRGSRSVSSVRFQGRDTAEVNFGTQITAILNDLQTRFPPLREEIG